MSEAGGSGKGEVKEMNTVCEGSSPRDHAIKTTGPNYNVPHRELTPLSASLNRSSSLSYTYFLWSVSHIPTYPQRTPHRAHTLHHMRIQVIQLEERYTRKGFAEAHTQRHTQPAETHLLYALRPQSETLELPIFRHMEEDMCNKQAQI